MSDLFDPESNPVGATPITDEQAEGLIPTWVATRAELNLVERENILKGRRGYRRPPPTDAVLDDMFVRRLHRNLFGDVWRWAGTYRLTEANIGIDPSRIAVAVADLLADSAMWLGSSIAPMHPDEAALELHHRMVAIHPFPNGNGRHAREHADLLLRSLGQPSFTWGARNLMAQSGFRTTYINGLKAADKGDYGPLRAFVRS
jgi:Fic-DOC domain mobile mystery protein B